jgi:hypothetical protein
MLAPTVLVLELDEDFDRVFWRENRLRTDPHARLGFIDYTNGLKVNNSLLTVVLHD